MTIKQQVWLAVFASTLMLGGMTAVSIIYLEGLPQVLAPVLGVIGIVTVILSMINIHRNMERGIDRIKKITENIAQGTVDLTAVSSGTGDEFGQLASSFHGLAVDLHHKTIEERSLRLRAEEQAWINTEVSEMALMLQGSVHLQTASRIFISRLASSVGGSYGAIYMMQGNRLQFTAGYAFDEAAGSGKAFELGAGLVGQCAVDKKMIVLDNLPDNYIRIYSGLGETPPSTLILLPVLYENDVVAVVELATMSELGDKELKLIERTGQNMGVLINTLADVARIEELLGETQLQKEELEAQTEELQEQTEELAAQTEELMAQTEELQRQKEELLAQSEELQMQTESLAVSNEHLQQQMSLTAAQKAEIEAQANELKQQADELLTSNKDLQTQMELTARQKAEIQEQADELQDQKEELLAQTEELQSQTEELQSQTEELQAQRDELTASNDQLQHQMELTAQQKAEIQGQADKLLVQASTLQDQKEELLAQTQELQAQTEELQSQRDELTASNDQLQRQMELTDQQKEEIKAQAEEIFMAAKYKSEFLANVSHELRTPLNSLLILSQILAENKEDNLNVKQLEYVHTIFSAGKDLLQLIDEILDLAKLEVGKMTPVMEPVSLHDASSHLFRHFEQQAKKKNLRLDVHCDSRVPDHLMTDGHRLQQIMNNLLSNAIKFTANGYVSLNIRTAEEKEAEVQRRWIVFEVEDSGIGIAAGKHELIFGAFQQADRMITRQYGGTGLGLSISNDLARLLGGYITLHSEENQGSRFALYLPL